MVERAREVLMFLSENLQGVSGEDYGILHTTVGRISSLYKLLKQDTLRNCSTRQSQMTNSTKTGTFEQNSMCEQLA